MAQDAPKRRFLLLIFLVSNNLFVFYLMKIMSFELQMETIIIISVLMIFAIKLCALAIVNERPEKFRLKRDSNPDLCDARIVLYQLS